MLTIAEAVRSIRTRRRTKLTEFAKLIASDPGTISRYESGAIAPSKAALLVLLLLAEGDEKQPILDALGVVDDSKIQEDFAGARQALEEYCRSSRKRSGKTKQNLVLAEFAKEAVAIVTGREAVEPSLVKLVQLWRQYGSDSRIHQHFRTAFSYLEVALTGTKSSGTQPVRARRRRN